MLENWSNEEIVGQHYGRGNLASTILDALKASGKYHTLTEEDLTPVDQFHIGGKVATLELAALANVKDSIRMLDVGGGLGGPARTLASAFGCSVIVLDITEEYCRVGEVLTTKTDLKDLVSFKHGSALDIPFPHMSFDVVWTQHSSMNISDKPRLYTEMHRVLKTGGRLALHEIMAGDYSPVFFPVPWARHQAISFLSKPQELKKLILKLGFKELSWEDETVKSLKWFREKIDNAVDSKISNPLGLHLLLGENFSEMLKNQIKNLEENRISVIKAVFEKI